jgi:hypothetical protein
MAIKIKPIKIEHIKIKPIRLPRGPTVRWSIDYDKLFKNKRRK